MPHPKSKQIGKMINDEMGRLIAVYISHKLHTFSFACLLCIAPYFLGQNPGWELRNMHEACRPNPLQQNVYMQGLAHFNHVLWECQSWVCHLQT